MENIECLCTQECAKGFNPNCKCNNIKCNCKDVENLIGKNRKDIFQTIVNYIDSNYDMDHIWNDGGKKWDYEYKFKKSSKTLCGFYLKKECLGFMVILGKNEREKFEQNQKEYSKKLVDLYNNTKTYHDGKWLMLELEDEFLVEDIKKLLSIKRKPKN